MNNKKGGITDGIFIVVGIFMIAIIFLLVYVMVSKVNTELQKSSIISQQGKDVANDLMGRYPKLFDNLFLFIVIGFGIAIIAGAWFINSHPALFWISIPILAFIIWLGGLYANIYTEFINHDTISDYSKDFPIMNFVFKNYIVLIMVYILMLAVALYAKQSSLNRNIGY